MNLRTDRIDEFFHDNLFAGGKFQRILAGTAQILFCDDLCYSLAAGSIDHDRKMEIQRLHFGHVSFGIFPE